MAGTNYSDDNKNVSGFNETHDSYRLLGKYIYLSITSVLLILGIVGNVLSLIVWNKGPRCKALSCALYFKILALTDICVLISYSAAKIFIQFTPIKKELLMDEYCELWAVIYWLKEFGPQISPWIIVTLSVERTISIMFPLKCSLKHSRKRAWISLGCIIIILVILHCLWTFRINNSDITFQWCSSVGYTKSDFKIIETLNIWVLAILPFIFIFVCNILILIQMFQMRKIKAVSGRGRRTEAFATFTILTVVTGLLHCLSVIPTMLFSIASSQYFSHAGDNFLNINTENNLNNIFWLHFHQVTILLNNSLNFYVYCLVGRDFRNDVRHVFMCCSSRNNVRVQNV